MKRHMKTRQYMHIVLAGLAASALPVMASAQVTEVVIEPGLYDYTASNSAAGLDLGTETFQYCITEGENRWNLLQLFAQNQLDMKCTLSNTKMTSSAGTTDVSCTMPGMGFTMTSKVEATYTKTSYDAKMSTKFPNMPVSINTIKATRSGSCPAGWVNPVFEDEDEDE